MAVKISLSTNHCFKDQETTFQKTDGNGSSVLVSEYCHLPRSYSDRPTSNPDGINGHQSKEGL